MRLYEEKTSRPNPRDYFKEVDRAANTIHRIFGWGVRRTQPVLVTHLEPDWDTFTDQPHRFISGHAPSTHREIITNT